MPRQKKEGGTGRGLPTLGIRLNPEMKEWLEAQAKLNGITMAEYVRDFLEYHRLYYRTYSQLVIWPKFKRGEESIFLAYKRELDDLNTQIADLEKRVNEEEFAALGLIDSKGSQRCMCPECVKKGRILAFYQMSLVMRKRLREFVKAARDNEYENNRRRLEKQEEALGREGANTEMLEQYVETLTEDEMRRCIFDLLAKHTTRELIMGDLQRTLIARTKKEAKVDLTAEDLGMEDIEDDEPPPEDWSVTDLGEEDEEESPPENLGMEDDVPF